MRSIHMITVPVLLVALLTFALSGVVLRGACAKEEKHSQAIDTAEIEQIIGLRGVARDGEFKITVPQKDLSVTVDGFRITPPMGLTSWVAFTPAKGRTMLMGDVVLLENEIGPVQKVVVQHGMTVTGLHNHFVRDKPRVMFMHVLGHDATGRLAKGVRAVLNMVKELRGVPPGAMETEPVVNEIDTKRIESILGHTGEMSGGVFKITIDRPDVLLKDHGVPVSSFLGFNTWAAFQGTAHRAAVAGDFAMLQDEVALVTRTLIDRGIEVVAMHNHMVTEEPRIVFLHYWGVGPSEQLAQALKDALGACSNRRAALFSPL